MLARKLIVATALVALAATACGSSSKTGTPSVTQPGGISSTTAAGGGGGASATTAPAKSFKGQSGGSFCDLVKSDDKVFRGPNAAASTPADFKALYANVIPALEEADNKAPSAIKSDMDTLVSGLKTFITTLAAANYDPTKISPTSLESLDTPAFKTATTNIDNYMSQVCHITTTT